MKIPIIDLFAGPGGLGEGFSSLFYKSERVFDIKLSIEKDQYAHQTLELRSFFRKFPPGTVPEEYYEILKESNLEKRNSLIEELYVKFKEQAKEAKNEAWCAELGSDLFPPELVDEKITEKLKNKKTWVLIGGPPCQAYSLAGRSRVGGIDEKDHRVYLYKEYLRIIAVHHPAVFVMENVKGLLSAKVNGEKVFTWILRDLRDPSRFYKNTDSPKYKIYSLTTKADFDLYRNPVYKNDLDYLIESEKYGVPQKRHRVILLGIREDIDVIPKTLSAQQKQISLSDVIGDLPKLRSGLNRTFISSKLVNGKKKRSYKTEPDSDIKWKEFIESFAKEMASWNGFMLKESVGTIKVPRKGTGSEFLQCRTPLKRNPLYEWFEDKKLNGVSNHVSRPHLTQDLKRYFFSSCFANFHGRSPKLKEFEKYGEMLLPDHKNAKSGKFADRFRVQLPDEPATTITSHISKDGHYFIHYDPTQCRSLTVREAARVQTFPDNYLFCGSRTQQFRQVGNAVPPYLAYQIAEIVSDIFREIETIEDSSKKESKELN